MTRFRLLAAVVGVVVLAGCDKNAVQTIAGPDPGARAKFFNFAVATAPATTPTVNFYANDQKMTGVLSTTGTESTSGVAYGGAAAGGFYSAIAPGQYTLAARSTLTADNGATIASLPTTIEHGKYYSFYMSGPYNATTKTSDAFIVEDPFPGTIDFSAALVRFVHAIHNANPMTLYARNTTTGEEVAVGGAVAYKAAGAFTALPGGAYDLSTRYVGSATNVMTRTAVTFAPGRVYTIGARGDINVASTRLLDNTANR
jgi:hypothetical protein